MNNGWTSEIARLQAELEQARDTATKAVQARIADAEKITKLEAEIERLYERDGKAHIEIIHPVLDDPNPFHRITLKKIDFGVADNCYVVECPEIESELEQARRERDEAREEIADLRGRMEESNVSFVAGVYMDRSIADFRRACYVLIAEEQRKPLPNNALVAVLCDSIRLSRELTLKAAAKDADNEPK